MRKQLEGSQGVAAAVALCRPDVVCAYPISPQTHIVEALGALCRKGELQNCEYVSSTETRNKMNMRIDKALISLRLYRLSP